MADVTQPALDDAVARVAGRSARKDAIIGVPTDVSKREEVERLKARAYDAFGAVHVLMNNAGRGGAGATLFGDPARWGQILDTNLWGVIHGVQVFGPAMIAQKTPGAIVNTGSKQGITTPPGETAYNVSKAGVKVVTEALAHELRNIEGCEITAHLLVPGFTFTTLTKGDRTEKPAAAWTPEQVVDFLLASIEKGDFYILCPDNDVTRAIDEKRMRWAMDDVIKNRPALSRWHADWKDAFAKYMAE
jgi:NAD(P)-dependent dehydrogenase (short-subunit alcohol dehydrogenase family)